MHIQQKQASRRTPLLDDQVQLFVLLTRELTAAYERQPDINLDGFGELPEYQRFLLGAYACGFVCRDFSPMEGGRFEMMRSRPMEHLADCTLNVLRHWVHTLLRAERWAEGWSSPIREAINGGALQLVAERLTSDQALREVD
jgi:hypothetical protein